MNYCGYKLPKPCNPLKIRAQGLHRFFNKPLEPPNFVEIKNVKMGISKREEMEYARILYVNERITFKEIAYRVKVGEKTVSKWAKEGNWEKLRQSMLTTRQTQLSRWYSQLDTMTELIESRDNIPTNTEADTMSKITSNIQKLEVEIGLGEIVETGKKLITFMQHVNLDDAKLFKNYFDEYINNRVKNG